MILPAVRERLEALLRHPSMEGVVGEVRSGSNLVGLSGLHDVAKPLVAAHVVHELRRPAFFVTENNRRAEDLAETSALLRADFPRPYRWNRRAARVRQPSVGSPSASRRHSGTQSRDAVSTGEWRSLRW